MKNKIENKIRFLFILSFFLLSFNVLFGERISFKQFSEEINKNIKDGSMGYIQNQQCFVSYSNIVVKNFYINHIKLYATCIEIDPTKKIEWDHPKIPEDAKIKVIYLSGEDFAEKTREEMKKGKKTFVFKKLAYYKKGHEKYKEDEYYYFE